MGRGTADAERSPLGHATNLGGRASFPAARRNAPSISGEGWSIMARNPVWACPSYDEHGQWAVCAACLERFRKRGGVSADLPPPVEFGRGWFSVGAVHWFAATDSTVYVARDGRRVLAQAASGRHLRCHYGSSTSPEARMPEVPTSARSDEAQIHRSSGHLWRLRAHLPRPSRTL